MTSFLRLGKVPLVFVKQQQKKGQRHPSWHNEETDPDKKKALDDFKARVGNPASFNFILVAEAIPVWKWNLHAFSQHFNGFEYGRFRRVLFRFILWFPRSRCYEFDARSLP